MSQRVAKIFRSDTHISFVSLSSNYSIRRRDIGISEIHLAMTEAWQGHAHAHDHAYAHGRPDAHGYGQGQGHEQDTSRGY